MNIALGTGSAYKGRLLKHVLTKLDIEPQVQLCKVSSRVADQPQSVGETKLGAINRAKAALEGALDAEVACGIEFGYEPFDGGLHCVAYACIANHKGELRIEHSSSFKLPRIFSDALAQGLEMSEMTLQFDQQRKNNNLYRSASDFLWKDELLIQAYHAVWVSYLTDQDDAKSTI